MNKFNQNILFSLLVKSHVHVKKTSCSVWWPKLLRKMLQLLIITSTPKHLLNVTVAWSWRLAVPKEKCKSFCVVLFSRVTNQQHKRRRRVLIPHSVFCACFNDFNVQFNALLQQPAPHLSWQSSSFLTHPTDLRHVALICVLFVKRCLVLGDKDNELVNHVGRCCCRGRVWRPCRTTTMICWCIC